MSDALFIWLRAAALIGALVVLFGGSASVRWLRSLSRARIIRKRLSKISAPGPSLRGYVDDTKLPAVVRPFPRRADRAALEALTEAPRKVMR